MNALLAHCSAVFSQHGGMFAVFFLGGLMGSLTHCLVMCGPVVACQSACAGGCGKRMSNASQWQYHVGRLLTYGALGFLAALLAKQIATVSYWPTISAIMMLGAGGLFLLSALLPGQHALLGYAPKNGFLRGVLMSFMPCGLIYAALMMASTLASPLEGMVAMWLFVLGTMPALLLASGSAALFALKWQNIMRGIGRLGMAFNGLTLLVLAVRSVG
jgi:sulfite exporter TauE/SafE